MPADRLAVRSGGVLVGDAWLEVPVTKGWIAASRLAVQAGRLVIAEVRVFPDEDTALRREDPGGRWSGEVLGVQADVPPGGLTARTLHAVRLGRHPRRLREILRFIAEKHGPDAFAAGGSLAALGLAPETERPRARRRFGRDDGDYAELAREYERLIKQGSRRPNAEIAAQRRRLLPDTFLRATRGFAEKQVVAKVTAWIHEARARGVLAPKKLIQGRAEGWLTPFGKRALRQEVKTSRRQAQSVRAQQQQGRTRRRK
ncbi:MAG: hypothetical protein HYS77_07230 [Candidatus Rokubacteria bacterium]|nr:hypothetical protein [Candidatus Rokubacteria bacterium]MBI4628061.1 hypothetical protein [Candidatus Rokubacteria bacterium]